MDDPFMAQILRIHSENPQARLIAQAVEHLQKGNVIVYPTDTYYALACRIGDKSAMAKIEQIRQLKANDVTFTIICNDLSVVAQFARVDNQQFRLLKNALPGAYTFILEASKEVPKRLMEKRKTIGLRVPDHAIVQALIAALGEPLLSTTLKLPDYEAYELNSGDDINDVIGKQVDLIIDGGGCALLPSSVIDLTQTPPVVLREGAGSWDFLK